MDENTISKVGIINKVQFYQPQSKSFNSSERDNSSTDAIGKAAASDTVHLDTTVTSRNLDTVRAIEQMHARLNQLVKSVRETNEAINSASGQLEQMKGNLQTVLKNFPPFSVDSKERQGILMGYVSLRKELLSLTLPPPPPPVYEKVSHMWDSLFDQSGQLKGQVVPDINPDSSDAQLNSASASIDKLSVQLADLSNTVTQTLVNS